MIIISKEDIDLTLRKLALKQGLDKYYHIQSIFQKVNVEVDKNFQRIFNGFYIIKNDNEWQEKYYHIFESERHNKNISFGYILQLMHKQTNRFEASFSSKLIATINPDLPVLDKFVLGNTGLQLPHFSEKNRLSKIVRTYSQLIDKVNYFKQTGNGQYLIQNFKETHKDYNITEIKMIDFVLWQKR